ncbi:MAG: hypothetical protein ACPKPY_09490 [Nitrososphaeraceae archaeon]
MNNDEVFSSQSNDYTILVEKCFELGPTVKTLVILSQNKYNGKDRSILDKQVREQLRTKITTDIPFICRNLNYELLGNRMLKASIAVRYGWSGRPYYNDHTIARGLLH